MLTPFAFPPTLAAALVPAGVPVWWYFTAVGLSVILFGMAKSGFGGGGIGILGVVLMANVMDAQRAVGVILPLLVVADVIALIQHHEHHSWFHLRWGLPGAAAGIAIGAVALYLFRSTGELGTALDLTIGSLCVIFVALQCYRLAGGKFPTVPNTAASAVTASTAAGAASTLAHSAGPIMTIYLLEHRLAKRVLVSTLVFFFFLVNLMKLPVFVGLGLIDTQTLVRSAIFVPLVPIGSLLGILLHKRIPEKTFALVMYVGAAIAGARMIYLGLGG